MRRDLWHAANNGAGKRMWFVMRKREFEPPHYLEDAHGRLRRFGSFEAANKVANAANGEGAR